MLRASSWGVSKVEEPPVFKLNPFQLEGTEDNPLVRYHEYGEEIAQESLLDFLPVIRLEVSGEEGSKLIRVSGFSSPYLVDDIKKAWKTTKISNHIFTDLTRRSFTCHEFFALEIIYMLRALINNPRTRTSNTTLEGIAAAMTEQTWVAEALDAEPIEIDISGAEKQLIDMRDGSPFSFLTGQKDHIIHLAENMPKSQIRGGILHADPGTGKTYAGYGTHLAFKNDVTFYFVPKPTLVDVWEKTLFKGFKKKPKHWSSSMSTLPKGNEEIVLCHYESMEKVQKVLKRFQGKRVGIWLDESHNFVEGTSRRTERFIDICTELDPIFVVWASGTPLKAMGKEVIPILKTLDPKRFNEQVEFAFKKVYGMSTSHALDILNHRLRQITFRVEKKDVMNIEKTKTDLKVVLKDGKKYTLDYVSKEIATFVIEQTQYYERRKPDIEYQWEKMLHHIQKKIRPELYDDLKKYQKFCTMMHKDFNQETHREIMQWCRKFERDEIYFILENEKRKEFKKLAPKYKYIVLVIRGQALGRILTRRRIECFKEMALEADYLPIIHQARAKTIFFTSYVEVAKALEERMKNEGLEPILVIGETNADLERLLKKSRIDPKANPVIATLKTLGTGVPMVHCNAMVFVDLPFRDYLYEQAVSRIERLGQKYPVLIVHTHLDTGIEKNLTERTEEILQWSKAQVDAMLNFDSSGLDENDML